jgi:uncharacterized protein (TIGR02246 family)
MEITLPGELQDAIERRDAASIAALYADDALFIAPGRPPARGRKAVRRAFEEDLANPGSSLSLTVERIEVAASGDIAYIRGALRVTFSLPGSGRPGEMSGSYLQVLRRRGGGDWLVEVDISAPGPAR